MLKSNENKTLAESLSSSLLDIAMFVADNTLSVAIIMFYFIGVGLSHAQSATVPPQCAPRLYCTTFVCDTIRTHPGHANLGLILISPLAVHITQDYTSEPFEG